jgi:putative membrane protein insertion efficiency factor
MNPLQTALIFVIRLYRWTLSPALVFLAGSSGRCRFTPSCSEFAREAIQRHGAFRGSWLAARRIARCHPWGGCGHDPVPEVRSVKCEVRNPRAENVLEAMR